MEFGLFAILIKGFDVKWYYANVVSFTLIGLVHYALSIRFVFEIKQAKSKGGRIIAIGTTVVRAIESAADADGTVRAGDGVARGRHRA